MHDARRRPSSPHPLAAEADVRIAHFLAERTA